jgi:DNA-binding transcriptional LysR family regulator
MVGKDHALAGRPKANAEAIVDYPLLLPKSGRTRSRINDFLEDYEDDIKISMELESSEMLKQFIVADLGIGFMALSHARDEIAAGELVALRLEPLPMTRTIGLIYRKDKALSRAAIGFIETVAAFAREADEPAAEKPKAPASPRKSRVS